KNLLRIIRYSKTITTASNSKFFVSGRIGQLNHFLAANILLKGVSVVRRNSLKPLARTVLRSASSEATAPSAGPSCANEFDVQHKVEAAANVRPMGLKFSSTVLPAIGSTIRADPSGASTSLARAAAPTGSPMSCRQSKKQIRSNCSSGICAASETANETRSDTPAASAMLRACLIEAS